MCISVPTIPAGRWCMDESNKQLIDDVIPPVPLKPKRVKREDSHYTRLGTCNLFVAFEPTRSW